MKGFWTFIILAILCSCGTSKKSIDDRADKRTLETMLYLEAVRQKNLGNMDASYDLLAKALETDSTDAALYYELAPFELKLGNDKKAGEYLKKAEKLNSKNSNYTERLAQYYMQFERYTDAIEVYERLYDRNHSRTEILELLMRLYQQQSNHEMALNTIDRFIDAEGNSKEMAQMKLTYLTLLKKPQEEILEAQKKLLEVAPEDGYSRFQLLQDAFQKEDWKKAQQLCQDGVRYNPEEIVFWYYLAVLNYKNDDEKGALNAYRKAAELVTEQTDRKLASDVYASLGDILHQQGDAKGAYESYDKALECNPDNVMCLNNYAYYISEEKGNLEKAEQMSKKTVEAEPENATYLDTYAWILYLQKRYTQALEYMEKAMQHLGEETDRSVYEEHYAEIKSHAKK